MGEPDLGLQGNWRLDKTDCFEEYMKAVGVGMVLRKLGAAATPDVLIKVDGPAWYIKTVTTFKTTEVNFTIGSEFDEVTPDGRNIKSTVTIDGNKLVHKQTGEPPSTITRELQDGFMQMYLKAKDVVCSRRYKRME